MPVTVSGTLCTALIATSTLYIIDKLIRVPNLLCYVERPPELRQVKIHPSPYILPVPSNVLYLPPEPPINDAAPVYIMFSGSPGVGEFYLEYIRLLHERCPHIHIYVISHALHSPLVDDLTSNSEQCHQKHHLISSPPTAAPSPSNEFQPIEDQKHIASTLHSNNHTSSSSSSSSLTSLPQQLYDSIYSLAFSCYAFTTSRVTRILYGADPIWNRYPLSCHHVLPFFNSKNLILPHPNATPDPAQVLLGSELSASSPIPDSIDYAGIQPIITPFQRPYTLDEQLAQKIGLLAAIRSRHPKSSFFCTAHSLGNWFMMELLRTMDRAYVLTHLGPDALTQFDAMTEMQVDECECDEDDPYGIGDYSSQQAEQDAIWKYSQQEKQPGENVAAAAAVDSGKSSVHTNGSDQSMSDSDIGASSQSINNNNTPTTTSLEMTQLSQTPIHANHFGQQSTTDDISNQPRQLQYEENPDSQNVRTIPIDFPNDKIAPIAKYLPPPRVHRVLFSNEELLFWCQNGLLLNTPAPSHDLFDRLDELKRNYHQQQQQQQQQQFVEDESTVVHVNEHGDEDDDGFNVIEKDPSPGIILPELDELVEQWSICRNATSYISQWHGLAPVFSHIGKSPQGRQMALSFHEQTTRFNITRWILSSLPGFIKRCLIHAYAPPWKYPHANIACQLVTNPVSIDAVIQMGHNEFDEICSLDIGHIARHSHQLWLYMCQNDAWAPSWIADYYDNVSQYFGKLNQWNRQGGSVISPTTHQIAIWDEYQRSNSHYLLPDQIASQVQLASIRRAFHQSQQQFDIEFISASSLSSPSQSIVHVSHDELSNGYHSEDNNNSRYSNSNISSRSTTAEPQSSQELIQTNLQSVSRHGIPPHRRLAQPFVPIARTSTSGAKYPVPIISHPTPFPVIRDPTSAPHAWIFDHNQDMLNASLAQIELVDPTFFVPANAIDLLM